MNKLILVTFTLLFNSIGSHANENKIVVWKTNIPASGIIGDTLKKALDITKNEYGDYQLIVLRPTKWYRIAHYENFLMKTYS